MIEIHLNVDISGVSMSPITALPAGDTQTPSAMKKVSSNSSWK
jgi:hypothetical protein